MVPNSALGTDHDFLFIITISPFPYIMYLYFYSLHAHNLTRNTVYIDNRLI